ncbi:unnamed protein product [Microthlaspi erraticum]|uniref:F-box domain-containing protein n=1 Tax=Microthlaspi erraticum TaxID=1685480 RepID=A0A6D2HRW8_9BRAS|nr:unnamed protein product [Microthlaspi erraticum]
MIDGISDLPDEIVCRILSFLPIEEAALTSVFSKRWRNLFAFSPDLHVRYVDIHSWNPKGNKSFTDFMDRVLSVSGNSTMRKFSMKIRQSVESSHLSRWMTKVLSRGILVIDLDILTKDEITVLPLEIFTSKTIVELKLGSGFSIATVPENAYLPALKTLFLSCIRFSGCAFEALLSACPVLEELTVLCYPRDPKQTPTVSCPSLERLTLSCTDCIDEYPIVNLDSLVEAKLTLYSSDSPGGNLVNLVKGLSNVETLHLSSPETSMGPLHSYGEYESENCECLRDYSFLSTCPVKVLEITEYFGTRTELEQMKHFLEKLSCLELVNVHAGPHSKLIFTTNLLLVLPKPCKFQLNCFPAKLE